jgi:hypothetical protein
LEKNSANDDRIRYYPFSHQTGAFVNLQLQCSRLRRVLLGRMKYFCLKNALADTYVVLYIGRYMFTALAFGIVVT